MNLRPNAKASPIRPAVWRISINKKALLTGVAKAAAKIKLGMWKEGLGDLPEVISAVSLAEKGEETIWRLIENSFRRAMLSLLRDINSASSEFLAQENFSFDKYQESSIVIEYNSDLFMSPSRQPFVPELQRITSDWLRDLGYADYNVKNISNRLPGYLALAFDEEWREGYVNYITLKDFVQSPFFNATTRALERQKYNARLAADVERPVFQETFGIRQVFVSPRAFYVADASPKIMERFDLPESSGTNNQIKNSIVVDLQSGLLHWLDEKSKDYTNSRGSVPMRPITHSD